MHNWKKAILKENNTIQEAAKALDKESLRIVMVVDDNGRLVGTITDGDIRRGLLNHFPMNTMLSEFMFTEPTVASAGDDRETILMQMNL